MQRAVASAHCGVATFFLAQHAECTTGQDLDLRGSRVPNENTNEQGVKKNNARGYLLVDLVRT